ncbi:MAG: sigma-54-dependent Fis family transcriptional regulator [Rhodospirillaceae bacterium]|jgi:transcriptional regulator with GAF, ATPase, and Fis domain|nr:sigma-54-dependent Fis family transcriptional regulator [Rhodospirillaceae bacterium]
MQHLQDFGDILVTINPFVDGVVLIADEHGTIRCQSQDPEKLLGWAGNGSHDDTVKSLAAFGPINLLSTIDARQADAERLGVANAVGMLSFRLSAADSGAAGNLRIHTKWLECLGDGEKLRLVVVQNDASSDGRPAPQLGQEDDMVSTDARMIEILSRVEQVAPSSAFVLLQGESGTGKTHIARLIHTNSSRRDEALVEVNCAAIPEQLIESELFGHVKGAFTGATSDRPGRFQAAHKGTLLLDEVGEIPLHLQAKLLKAVQEQRFEMVGSDKSVSVDVRVISASNRDLKAMVEAGEFRADLYYRLAVIPMIIPPLRERPEDIPLMLKHLCTNLVERGYPDNIDCSPEAMRLMMDYFWPGNVREMENAVEHAVVCAVNNTVRPESLPQTVRDYSSTANGVSPSSDSGNGNGIGIGLGLDEPENLREMRDALDACGGNKSRAAKMLGIDRTTLWRRMQRHGLGA